MKSIQPIGVGEIRSVIADKICPANLKSRRPPSTKPQTPVLPCHCGQCIAEASDPSLTMSRSPSDATRFTATEPHVSTRASQINFGKAPPGETPQQKIARLRAAAALARLPQESRFDKVVRVGRVWADYAHRITVLGLMGLSVLSALVAVAGVTDMVVHNRRRRKQWYAEQEMKRAAEIVEANGALGTGTATQDQILLLNQERAKEEAARAKQNRPGMVKRTSDYLFGSLAKEEQKGGALGAVATQATAHSGTPSFTSGEKASEENGVLRSVIDTVEAHRREGERVEETIRSTGGPLDHQAQHLVDAATGQGQTWRNWLGRR